MLNIQELFSFVFTTFNSIINFIAEDPIIGVTLLGVGALIGYILLQKSEVAYKIIVTQMMIIIFVVFLIVMIFAISQKYHFLGNVTSIIENTTEAINETTTTLEGNRINIFH